MRIIKIYKELPNGFVDIHNQAFNDFFLTSLGYKILKLYYSSVIKSSKGRVVCLFDENDKIVGFAAGTNCTKGFHKEILLKNKLSYAWVLFNVILTRPKAILRLFKNLNKSKKNQLDDEKYSELLSIAVPSKYKGLGYGKMLLIAFESELESLNVEKIALTTDYYNNEGVLAFYKKMGYKIFYDFVTYPNRRMYKLIKEL